jgi:hypothetical protein
LDFTSSDGFKGGTQTMLNKLFASVAFDPLAFTRLEPAKQLLNLRGLVELDVDVDALEKSNVTDYDKRRDLNRDLKTAESTLLQMPKHDGIPAEPVDEAALETAIASASETNGQIERRRVNREQFADAILVAAKARRDEFTASIAEQKETLAKAEPLPELVDVTEVQASLRAARATNEQIAANARHRAQAMRVEALKGQVTTLTTAMDERKTTIAEAIERANMPVPGLGFGDGEVLFNGLPLDQASSAEQLRVSTAIGMATSPKLRVMLVRDGSLLDDEGEKILADLAEENDFQLWVEAVDTSGKVGIVLEDGAVVSIDGEPAPEPEAIAGPKRRKRKIDASDETLAADVNAIVRTVGPDVDTLAPTDADFEPVDMDGDVQPEADRDPDDVPWNIEDQMAEGLMEEIQAVTEPEAAKPAKAAPVGLFD